MVHYMFALLHINTLWFQLYSPLDCKLTKKAKIMVEKKQYIQYSDVVFFKGYPSPESFCL